MPDVFIYTNNHHKKVVPPSAGLEDREKFAKPDCLFDECAGVPAD